LNLNENQLSSLPSELSNLPNLASLGLIGNQLSSVPPEIGNLPKLTSLSLEDNPLISPPPEVFIQGTSAILEYLQDQAREQDHQLRMTLVSGALGVGLLVIFILSIRRRTGSQRKSKRKNNFA